MRVWIVLLALAAGLMLGCEKSADLAEKSPSGSPGPAVEPESTPAKSPIELLQAMASAYAQADSYFDQGKLRLSRTLAGETTFDDVPFAVKLQRPNQLRVDAYQVTIACDGNRLVAKIFDEATDEMDHQALVRPAPEQIDAATLYIDPQQSDPILSEILVGGIVGPPPTLEMLLAKEMPDFSQEADNYVVGVDDTINGRRCHRLICQTPNGPLTMYVDAENFLLRRIEYPQEPMLSALKQSDPNAKISLVADFVNASINDPIHENEFLYNIHGGDKQVAYFVRPAQATASPLLGEKPQPFSLERLSGEKIASTELLAAPTVLAWINDHPSSRLMTDQLTRFAADASTGVEVKLVSVDPHETPGAQVLQRLEQWGANFPVYRDADAVGQMQFRIPGAPTVVLLDDQGRVQFYEAGASPDLAERLWDISKRLTGGENVAETTLAAVQAEKKLYQAALAASMAGKNPYRDLPLPSVSAAAAREFDKFAAETVWSTSDVESPGAVAVLRTGDAERIFVLDGGKAICELDAEGKLVSRHVLSLGEDVVVDRMRVAASDKGLRVALFQPNGQRLWLLDENLEPLFRYPTSDAVHAGIADAQLLSGFEQTTLVVAFQGEIGAHGIDESGKRLWSFREMLQLRDLAPVGPGEIAVMDASSRALVIDRQGKVRREIGLPQRSLLSLCHDPVSGQLLALALAEIEMLEFDALAKDGAQVWSYPLPAAELPQVSPKMAAVSIGELRGWCGLGPDGTVHVMQADGAATDRMAFGEMPLGLGTVGSGDLIIALPDRVVRLRLAPRR
ncbi:outer membrane protein assembly factor BamB family protein [Blastopirellula retiformator]|uniref:Thioredoxin domain-containing protein n=1 Tax=Blastopirellula retiformator TaxID=2527970 RepID=A0A5C5UYK2_9BACT|nr:PQQ-binding-like beta-propeller repeat protein [Blastopirellula retiformator]TWT30587.1 hypothetical protein Enr8_41080 [Blastopirellula retiformator]